MLQDLIGRSDAVEVRLLEPSIPVVYNRLLLHKLEHALMVLDFEVGDAGQHVGDEDRHLVIITLERQPETSARRRGRRVRYIEHQPRLLCVVCLFVGDLLDQLQQHPERHCFPRTLLSDKRTDLNPDRSLGNSEGGVQHMPCLHCVCVDHLGRSGRALKVSLELPLLRCVGVGAGKVQFRVARDGAIGPTSNESRGDITSDVLGLVPCLLCPLRFTIQRLVGKGSHQVNSKILRIEMSVDQCVQCVKIERVVEKVWPAQHLLSWVAGQVARKLLSELIFSDSISESEVEFLQHLALMPDSSPLVVVGGT
mmetsp:Transcript_9683/g.32392  ORF Transcript_9683/g.32392 Transcript_9683/m.32392 type:complete len:309 (+) Transcript_9683:1242-2168(+)